MTTSMPVPIASWLIEPLSSDVARSMQRLRQQPDVQYIVNPGGHVAGPNPAVAIKNAAIVGLRSTIKF